MSNHRQTSLFIASLVLSIACATGGSRAEGGDGDGNDGDSRADASVPRTDAATVIDAAQPAADAAPDAPTPALECTEDATIECGELVEHSLFFADQSVAAYSCETVETTGVENIYRFSTANDGTVTLELNVLEDGFLGDDFDLYVLEDVCEVTACAAQATEVGDELLTFAAVGGATYYIVVEAYAAGFLTVGNYDLQVTCP